jgi:NAD(P)-dependent dehydrogenase (short-subunit alcohol dehydrogenase family)
MDLELESKHAIVTGGSRGIGLAIARELAREGASVAIAARDETALRTAAASLATTGYQVVPIVADIRDDASVRTMVARAADELGGVDILVNNAASVRSLAGGLADLTDEQLLGELDTKVVGYLRCIRAVAPIMVYQSWGRIINVGGIGARQTGSIVSSIRNISIAAMTKTMADELGPHGVNVTVVHPGPTRTESNMARMADWASIRGVDTAQVERDVVDRIAIRRMVEPSEVASVIAFLASPRSVAISGDAIVCGGGAVGSIYY